MGPYTDVQLRSAKLNAEVFSLRSCTEAVYSALSVNQALSKAFSSQTVFLQTLYCWGSLLANKTLATVSGRAPESVSGRFPCLVLLLSYYPLAGRACEPCVLLWRPPAVLLPRLRAVSSSILSPCLVLLVSWPRWRILYPFVLLVNAATHALLKKTFDPVASVVLLIFPFLSSARVPCVFLLSA